MLEIIVILLVNTAHQDCNLKLRLNPEEIKIPVIFHNLRGYDSHFIMQQIGEITKKHTYKNYKGEEKQMNIMPYLTTWKSTWLSCLAII